MGEEFSTGDIRHQHVNVEVILKGGVEVYDKGVTDTCEDKAFSVDVFYLS